MIIYTRLLPTGGFTCTPWLILINTKYRGDVGLIAHERVHQAQMRREGLLWFWWRYVTHQSYRLMAEIEAYRMQMAHGADPVKMAWHLAHGYRIGLSQAVALTLLLADKI